MSGILRVLYTCKGCGIVKRPVTVRHRADGEDIRKWMDEVVRMVAVNHHSASPFCKEGKCDLMIPVIDAAKPIGTVENHP